MIALALTAAALLLGAPDGAGATALSALDVKAAMEGLLRQHVAKKALTPTLLQGGVINYIEQFDPHKVYLLEEEVAPYRQLPAARLSQLTSDYQHNRYPLFEELDRLFQRAIGRARALRARLLEQWRAEAAPPPGAAEAAARGAYSDSVAQLTQRQRARLAAFMRRREDGAAPPSIADYEQAERRREEVWLYRDRQGRPLPAAAQQELFCRRVLKALACCLDVYSGIYDKEEAAALRRSLLLQQTSPDEEALAERAAVGYLRYEDGIIGVIRLDLFYDGPEGGSSADVHKAIAALQRRGRLLGLLLDLRGNHGGFMAEAVQTAGLFISSGVVAMTKMADGSQKYFRDLDGDVAYDGPVVVLVSRTTASAAELLAMALQDWGVALVVGDERTYGKGTVQRQTVTDGRASPPYKVTVGRFYSVSGRSPQSAGVQPDIVVRGATAFDHYRSALSADEYIRPDAVAGAYHDTLSDLSEPLQGWFRRHYLPVLQQQSHRWSALLPLLRQRSVARQQSDARYQEAMAALRLRRYASDQKDALRAAMDERQRREALAILKDMIDSERRGGASPVTANAAAPAG